MAQIIRYRDIAGDLQREDIAFNGSLGEWLVAEYKGRQVPFSVFEGSPSSESFIKICADSVDMLMQANGDYTVIETAGTGVEAAYIITTVLSIIIAVYAASLVPDPKLPQNINRRQESPNNSLSERANRARPFERLADIKGTVKSIPDKMMPEYRVFSSDGTEVEYGAYAFGRKKLGFDFTTWNGNTIPEVKDGDTPLQLIDGAGAKIYWPNDLLASPTYEFGESFSEGIYGAYRNGQVDGQVIDAFFPAVIRKYCGYRANTLESGTGYVRAASIGMNTGGLEFDPAFYYVGAQFVIEDALVQGLDVSGTFTITMTSAKQINFAVTGSIPWNFGGARPIGVYFDMYNNYTIRPASDYSNSEPTDWFYMTRASLASEYVVNVIAPQGLYIDTGAASLATRTINYNIEIQQVDGSGNPVGSTYTLSQSISGNKQSQLGKTVRGTLASIGIPNGFFRVRLQRTTTKYTGDGAVGDEIKLRDVYALEPYSGTDFGDMTWIHTMVKATESATSARSREVNAVVYERLEPYTSPTTQGVEQNNNNAIQSLIASALDPVEGNLTTSDIDIAGLLAVDAEITSYFTNSGLTNFCFTFDSTETTFQTMAQMMLNAINCIGYREGGQIKAYFEGLQTVPAMLFTHRSKLPDETYTRRFNDSSVSDGVVFKWINPSTYTQEKILIPEVGATKPQTFEIAGIQNEVQALVRANREYNKIKYQKMALEFTATAEGRYVRVGEMISVVKGSRTKTYDGEVIGVSGLDLTLSQDVDISTGTWYVQLKSETGAIESILATQGGDTNIITLASPPTMTIRSDLGAYGRRTEFCIGITSGLEAQRWLPQVVDNSDIFTTRIRCINYSDEYYAEDGTNYRGFDAGFDSGFGL